jgi:hypothetical protein
VPITQVKVVDQYGDYRRWTPNATDVNVFCHGNLALQRWMIVEMTDAKGGRCYSSPIRNLPARACVRCMDRQNMFTALGGWEYTMYPAKAGFGGGSIQVPGVTVPPGPYIPKLDIWYTSADFWVIGNASNSKPVPGGGGFMGDNTPIWHDQPIPEYDGQIRLTRMISQNAYGFFYDGVVTIKKDLTAAGTVWPIVTTVPKGAAYSYTDASGKEVNGTLGEDTFVDLPPGGTAVGILALAPLRVNGKGDVGFPAENGKLVKAGTTYRTSWLNGGDAALRGKLGLSEPWPPTFTFAQGKLERRAVFMDMAGENGAVQFRCKAGPDIPFGIRPLRVTNANPRWPSMIVRNDERRDVGYFETGVIAAANVVEDCDIFLGNVLYASDPDLNLAFASAWDAGPARVEVNNPTDRQIKATIRSTPHIKGVRPVNADVTVPAGSTVLLDVQ